jgi:hypothetical protein
MHKNVNFLRQDAEQHEPAKPSSQQEISAEFKKAIEAEDNFIRVALNPEYQIEPSVSVSK